MFPNRPVANIHGVNHLSGRQNQRGFLLPLALFILIVMGALAIVVARTSSQTHRGFTQELLNNQAFYAAESGAQRGMQVLFFPDPTHRLAVDARCAALNKNYNFSGTNGLQLCSAKVSCSCAYRDGSACDPGNAANYLASSSDSVAHSYYTLTSKASCGQSEFMAERTIQAGSYLDQE